MFAKQLLKLSAIADGELIVSFIANHFLMLILFRFDKDINSHCFKNFALCSSKSFLYNLTFGRSIFLAQKAFILSDLVLLTVVGSFI